MDNISLQDYLNRADYLNNIQKRLSALQAHELGHQSKNPYVNPYGKPQVQPHETGHQIPGNPYMQQPQVRPWESHEGTNSYDIVRPYPWEEKYPHPKRNYNGIDVAPGYKKGGALPQDYRDWEKEMYDSYKCGGKTKKKSCGGEMKPKKKACGGIKIKK